MPVPTHHAVVLGGGLAGILAAHVLAEHVDTVTIIDRDDLPEGPEHRKGTPQARHTHVFVEGGYAALEDLLPGITDELTGLGAHQLHHPADILVRRPTGWRDRMAPEVGIISASRALTDWAIRRRVLAHPRITVAPPATVVGLLGDRRRISGVRLRDRGATDTRRLTADLVIDATGRSSHTHDWLTELKLPAVHREHIDSGIRYATRVYQAPPGTPATFPLLLVEPNPASDRPAVAGMLSPIEDDRWILTLVGPKHDPPPTDEDGYPPFLRSLADPILADLIAAATPLTPPYGFANTANHRNFYERARFWPDGLLVLGDAYATFNPIYGHGMATAVLAAHALRRRWQRHHPLLPGAARRSQRAIAKVTEPAWRMATAQDLRLPHTTTTGRHPGRLAKLNNRYADRMIAAIPGRPDLQRASLRVFALLDSPLRLFTPRVLWQTLRGPRGQYLPEAPLTPEERRILTPASETTADS
ncbi:FAD-dependent monooxygenase [Crossiella sp. SN42]|uniref:NAD(P)/FAD-dependent oxidoreductase n=1 Tax=Crossiella sp. SN42 TaxID=2944808 RepID=UPI00207CE898|nr:FAD-dependent oxidoreductase [Crossiella sp. SN42]MCO1576233.1 FAD-dependent monooxygenase [Crossiella sp. SN42]